MPLDTSEFYRGIKLLFISCCLTFISQPALCDEALLKVYGGGLKMLDGESTSVRMESETVRIELHETTYTVDATFDFFNYGNTLTANVGFPKSGYGYNGPFNGVITLNLFETWINGEKVSVKEMPGEMTLDRHKIDQNQQEKLRKGIGNGWIEETRWLVKRVTFKGNATTVTRVKYTVPYGLVGNVHYGEYLYGTGKSWKGTIGKAIFIIKASPKVSHTSKAVFTEDGQYRNKRQYRFKRLSGYEYEYTLDDFEPKENENMKFDIELNSGPWNILSPDEPEEIVSQEKLEMLSIWELKILRNARYAYHGKIFKDPELSNFFKKYDWYKPRDDFKESDLTKTEQANVKAFLDYETELKNISHRK